MPPLTLIVPVGLSDTTHFFSRPDSRQEVSIGPQLIDGDRLESHIPIAFMIEIANAAGFDDGSIVNPVDSCQVDSPFAIVELAVKAFEPYGNISGSIDVCR